ncbi:hypothetical protein [Bacillus massiliglaciei]|uniref:hypothetical protein n=1 Tax=Bacillus massiliglaciei TaxID=1816693 RepID=UPI000DA6095B|nr:hypothetical protein [Bacillus massiliglaciei]
MPDKKEAVKKGRLTLTGNKMPDEVYRKLEEKGADRKLTPYIVSLVEKEDMMDKLIQSLSTVIQKVDHLSDEFSGFKSKFDGVEFASIQEEKPVVEDEIKQGDLGIKDNILGGIEEDLDDDYDF